MQENHSLPGEGSVSAKGSLFAEDSLLAHGSSVAGSSSLPKRYDSHFNRLREVYDRALGNHNFESLLVYSGEIKHRFQDDMPIPFFINLQFKAIVPLTTTPECWIIWRVAKKPILLLYQPETVWDAVVEIPDAFWSSYFEIVPIKNKEDAHPFIHNAKCPAFLGEHTELTRSWDVGPCNPERLINELNWYRSYKTEYELYCINEANRISAKGHARARTAFFAGASEFEIALEFQNVCQQTEDQLSFPSTVAINQHASILHYWERDAVRIPSADRNSFLIDAGATCNGYNADICRTYAYRDGLFADMISALDSIQQTLVSQLIVGSHYIDSANRTQHQLASLLKDFQLINLEPDTAVELGIIQYFFPHNVSHFLGLQVHDVGGNQADITGALIDPELPAYMMRRPIEANQVLTVEPGIYFIESLMSSLAQSEHRKSVNWDRIAALMPFGGIRIEDNVLIAATGPVNLTRRAFSELESL